VLLTSMDHDGTRAGFALEMLRAVTAAVPVPVIASGGAGESEHFADAFEAGAAAALAASVFHFGALEISAVKEACAARGFPMRR
jgi:cyclase